jgi:hypothetical protein
MTPYKTWKANKGRIDLRKFTREFESKFKVKSKIENLPGEIYAFRYFQNAIYETDKHHITPIIMSFGRFRDENDGHVYVRGLNLLYLKTSEMIEVLEEAHNFLKLDHDSRVEPLLSFHKKLMKRFSYSFKNFEEKRILSGEFVDASDWGMIPLLQKNLWGTFNPVALNEDFQKEMKSPKRMKKVKRSTEQEDLEAEDLRKLEEEQEKIEMEFAEEFENYTVDSDDI